MTYQKEVIKVKGDSIIKQMKECHPREMPLSLKFVEKWWFDAIYSVYQYEKQRGLVGRHLMMSDNRIEAGLKLYNNKHIKELTITREHGGDVLGYVESEDKKRMHTVIIKNFLPVDGKIPSYNYQRENYISNLKISCDCSDFLFGVYKDNASLCCKHITAILFYLQDKWNAPKLFVRPEEKMLGFKRSDTVELEKNIESLPLIRFTYFLNILLLRNYRGMMPAWSVSFHRVSNDTHEEIGKPLWATFTSDTDATKRLIRGIGKAYREMKRAGGLSDKQIDEQLCKALEITPIEKVVIKEVEKPRPRNRLWMFWRKHINR